MRAKMRQNLEINSSVSSTASVEILNKKPPTYDLGSSDEERDEFRMPPPKAPLIKSKKIVIKAEKLSLEAVEALSASTTTLTPSVVSSTSSTETLVADTNRSTSAKTNKTKKQKNHQPIKVERISEIFENSPMRTRTRSQRNSKKNSLESVYEDALPGPDIPSVVSADSNANGTAVPSDTMICNATINLGPNATVNMGPNATITLPNKSALPDATFQVNETVNIGNATTVISRNAEETFNVQQRKSSNIMTEDSEDEEDFTPIVTKSKKHELFK